MTRVEVIYHLCGPRACSVEQFQDGGKIVGHGKVLRKCVHHASVADADLVGVLHAEGAAAKEARRTAPPNTVALIRFEGAGASRRAAPVYLDRGADG